MNAKQHKIVELLQYVSTSLVDEPDQVRIESSLDSDGVTQIVLKLAKPDVGRVIGRNGRTVDALRALVDYASEVENQKYQLQIFDE